jgi:hypothetical protein
MNVVEKNNDFSFREGNLYLNGLRVVSSIHAIRRFRSRLRYMPPGFEVPIGMKEHEQTLLRFLSDSECKGDHVDVILFRHVRHKGKEAVYYYHQPSRMRFVLRLINDDPRNVIYYKILTIERSSFFGERFQDKLYSDHRWVDDGAADEEMSRFLDSRSKPTRRSKRRKMTVSIT